MNQQFKIRSGVAHSQQRVQEGRPFPLGSSWDGLGVNFALFSANATKVELCLFDSDGSTELERIELPEYTDEVWHGYLPDIRQRQPLFHRGRFLTGSFNEDLEVKDVTWFDPSGTEMESGQWQDGNAKCVQMLLDGRAQATGIRKKGADLTLLLMFNAHHEPVEFTFPEGSGRVWKQLIETSNIERQYPHLAFAATHELEGRSLALWEIKSLA